MISVGHLEINDKIRKAVNDVLDSGRISEGRKTYEFEKKWAEYIGTKYCVAVSSGTAALITVLTALKYLYKLESRPKVITSPLTYISDANAIVLSGFEPVFVDIDPHDFCINPENIEKHLEKADAAKYSIILPIDLMGYPVDMERIKAIAKKYNLFILEDAAEAHGTTYDNKKCGSDVDVGIFSFYVAHNTQAGEMGAITTNDYDLFGLCKQIKSNGRICKCGVCTRAEGICPLGIFYDGMNVDNEDFDPRFYHDKIGYNFKTMDLQAAIALAQIDDIDDTIQKRQENVIYLNDGLAEFKHIFDLPIYNPNVSYLAYPLVIKQPKTILRKKIRSALEKKGIETRPIFGCIPTQQPAYAYLKEQYEGKLPNAEKVGKNGFYIGCHQYLTKDDLDYIIAIFKEIGKNEGII